MTQDSQTLSLFSTPVFVFQLEGLAALDLELRDRLLAESRVSGGIERSIKGGWHSVPDLAKRHESCYQGLMQLVVYHARVAFDELARGRERGVELRFDFSVHGWATLLRDGDHCVLHDHADAHWSTVYYVDPGDADLTKHPDAGALVLVDPRRGSGSIAGIDLSPGHFIVKPKQGMLVVFPGWLQHYVNPYRGERERISIACNVRMAQVSRMPRT